MKFLIFFIIIFIFSCTKQQSILICGDHKCINKTEAKQYFEENLTLEVQIVSKNKNVSFDLVALNTKEGKSEIKVFENTKNKVVKKLSKKEIKAKQVEINNKKKIKKLEVKKQKENKNLNKIIKQKVISTKKIDGNTLDICLKVEKCDIDSITNYLIKLSSNKECPNISLKE